MHLNKCIELLLNGNQLIKIETDTFQGLKSLEKLRLTNNDISVIESGSFKSLNEIKELYLSDNRLTTLRKDAFGSIPLESLYLYISGNPLHCDRRMCWIKQGEEDNWIDAGINSYWGYPPQCAYGDWDELNCSVTGENSQRLYLGSIHTCDSLGVNHCVNISVHAIVKN